MLTVRVSVNSEGKCLLSTHLDWSGYTAWTPHTDWRTIPAMDEHSISHTQEARKEMFYLTTHSTHIIYGHMVISVSNEDTRYHAQLCDSNVGYFDD